MNKKELTASVARKTELTCVASAQVIEAVFETIRENLEKNQSIVIQGFGSFSVTSRLQRMGVNPSTKQPMIIPARKVVRFSVSKKITIK